MKKNILFLLVAFATVCVLTAARAEGEKVYGVWYFMGEDADPAVVSADMKKIAAMGFNHIMFPGFVNQKTAASLEVKPPTEKFLKALAHGVEAARAAGLKVSVTGFLLVGDGAWRGTIMPIPYKKWAVSYFKAIEPLLKLSEEKKVELFCIGSEMETMKKYGDVWKYVIKNAREIYKGALGYNTNWWSGESEYNFILNQMDWLAELDFIGVSGYFGLTKSDNPTRAEIEAGWSKDSRGQNLLEQFAGLKKKYPAQKLYSWEVGYRSMDGTNRDPWNWGRTAGSDPAEQADCFAAFMAAFRASALDGFVVWALDPGLNARELGYDFYGKPAQSEFEKYFKANTAYKEMKFIRQ
ncbi:MAG: hypothetical protein WCX65_18570 [bacterium]